MNKGMKIKRGHSLYTLIRDLDAYSTFKHICVAKGVSMTKELERILRGYCKEEIRHLT